MSEQNNASSGQGGSDSAKPARKRRGWWWKIPLVLVVLLVLLVLLIPTIASTSPVRGYALSKINASIPGKLEVADWSLGWFSGTSAKGISFTDDKGHKLVDVSAVTTPVTLMQLVRGNLHAGQIVIPDVTVDAVVPAEEPKVTTKQDAPAPAPSPAPKPSAPAKTTFDMPDTSATVKIEHIGGKVTFLGKGGKSATITLDKSSTLQMVLPPGGGPAKCDVNLVVVQPTAPATITVSATVNGLKTGTVDYTQLTGQAQVKVNGLDLDQVAGIARVQGSDLAVKGVLSGQIDAAMPRPMEGTVKGELAASDVTTMLGKDQIVTKQLRIPVDVALSGGGDATRVAINQIGVLLDQAKVNVMGDLPLASLKQFGNGEQITQDGSVKVTAEVPDLAAVLNTLHNTVPLQQGVAVSSGRLDVQVNATLGKDGLRVQTPISLRDLAAVRDGRKIGPLQPFTVDAGATIPNGKAGAGEIRDLAVNINSSFLTLNAKGSSIYATNAQGECDLVKLRDDLGSIVDLSMIRGGKLTLSVVNRAPEKDVLESTVRVQLTGVGVILPSQGAPVAKAAATQPAPAGNVAVAAAPRRLEDGNVLISVRTVLRDKLLTISEPARIEASGRLLEGAPGQASKVLLDQAATVIMAGSLQTDEKKLHLTGLSVTAGKDKPVAQVSLPDRTAADLTMAGKRGVSGAVKLAVRADLGALQEISQRYSETTTAPAPAAAGEGLKSGMFIGNVGVEITPAGDLKIAVTESSLDFDYVVSAKSYRDHVALTANTDISGDNSKIGAALSAKGSTVSLATKAQLAMAAAAGGAQELKEIRIDQLDGKTDFADVSLVQPLVISDMPALLAAFAGKEVPAGVQIGGELLLNADIAKVMALTGKSSADAYAMTGMLTFKPKIALVQKAVVADFSGQVESLKVSQGAKTVVEEPKLTMGGHVSVDPNAKVLAVENTQITSASGLLDLKASVKVSQYGAENKLENGVVDLTPDLGKIWPIIYAMMPPEKQKSIGEMVVSGRKTSHITFGGSFPTNRPYGEAIKLVSAGGDFPIESVDWKKYGVTLSGVIPFTLKDGVVKFAYADKAAAPLACNQGTIDLSKASIDLRGNEPRLNIDSNSTIASKLQLSPVMVASLGGYLSPVFGSESGESRGAVDVVCDRCNKLPLGQLMFSPEPANDGVAQFSVKINGLKVAGGGLDKLLSLVGKGGGSSLISGDLTASVGLQEGRCLQKLALPVNQTMVPFEGDMRLADNYYNYLKMALPSSFAAPLLGSVGGLKLAADDLPPSIDLKFAGPANNLKLQTDIKSLVAPIAQQQLQKRLLGGAGAGLGGLVGQPKATPAQGAQGSQATSQPAAQQKPNAVEEVKGLIDIFGKKKK